MAKTLGENLKRLRGAMTQEELAALSGVAQNDISKWERGKSQPTLPSLIRLAKGLQMPVEEFLMGLDDDYDQIARKYLSDNNKDQSTTADGTRHDLAGEHSMPVSHGSPLSEARVDHKTVTSRRFSQPEPTAEVIQRLDRIKSIREKEFIAAADIVAKFASDLRSGGAAPPAGAKGPSRASGGVSVHRRKPRSRGRS